jgi:hypothetical protein
MLDFEAIALLRRNAKREREAAAEHRDAQRFAAANACMIRAQGYEDRAARAETRALVECRR